MTWVRFSEKALCEALQVLNWASERRLWEAAELAQAVAGKEAGGESPWVRWSCLRVGAGVSSLLPAPKSLCGEPTVTTHVRVKAWIT